VAWLKAPSVGVDDTQGSRIEYSWLRISRRSANPNTMMTSEKFLEDPTYARLIFFGAEARVW
jgi:hypothetical protein